MPESHQNIPGVRKRLSHQDLRWSPKPGEYSPRPIRALGWCPSWEQSGAPTMCGSARGVRGCPGPGQECVGMSGTGLGVFGGRPGVAGTRMAIRSNMCRSCWGNIGYVSASANRGSSTHSPTLGTSSLRKSRSQTIL